MIAFIDQFSYLIDKRRTDLAAGVDVSTRVADGDSTDHLAMVENTQLSCMTWDSRPNQCIRWERHWLHLTVGTHVE